MEFGEFTQQYHDYLCSDPNRCVFLGVSKNLDRLPDPSAEYQTRRHESTTRMLEHAKRVDSTLLDEEDGLDLELAQQHLERTLFEMDLRFEGRPHWAICPRAGDDISDGIFFLFINDPRPDVERLVNIVRRIQSIPEYLHALIARLQFPVQRWVQIDIEKVRGLPEFFSTLADWASTVDSRLYREFKSAQERAVQAMSTYCDQLASMPTSQSFSIGAAATATYIQLRGIELSPDELHSIAKEYLRKNQAEIDALSQIIRSRHGLPNDMPPAEIQTFLNHAFQVQTPNNSLDDILVRYQEERARILQYIRAHDLFPVFEEQDMKILRTPAFMAPSIPAGAMFSPPPFREGIKTSLVYLTLSEELMDEHTELSIPSMMIHEGIPGHHLHLATAANHPSIIRRHHDAMDQAEGWTTMLEDYMLDHGYLTEHVEEARFCGKRDIARIAARVSIDLYFMSGDRKYLDIGVDVDTTSDDPFVAAGNLLKEVTGFTDGRVQAELNWYSQERGYPLSYLAGNHLVWKLKNEVAGHLNHLDAEEIDRVFHRAFLAAGNMPVSRLWTVFQRNGLVAN